MNGALLYAACIGICGGIALALLSGAGFLASVVSLAAAGACVAFGARDKKFLLAAVSLAVFSLGALRTELFLETQRAETLPTFIGTSATVEGKILADPDRRAATVHVTLAVSSVNGSAAHGMLLAFLPPDTAVSYGDAVAVRGPIAAPQAFQTDAGREFDYPSYLRAQGISALMQKARIERDAPAGASIRGILFSLKRSFEHSLERVLPAQQSALLQGVLLGERHGVSQALTDAFIAAGLVHVVVLSGYNISIVAESALRLFSFLPRMLGFSFGGVSIVVFALMTGGGATTVRACIMALIAILARYARRPAVAMRSLALAAAGMALWNPSALLFDPSFILSVLATFGLIALSPWVEAHLPAFLSRFPSVRSIAASTIAVQIFVLPALLYFTDILSFLALPANVLALPVVPLSMLAGFLAGVLGWLSPLLAFLPALLADLLLRWMIAVAQVASSIPFSAMTIAAFPAWAAAILYVPLTGLAIFSYRRSAAPLPTSSDF